ncbi:bifunctional phosphopantothenoylcysteine decarboxylase/phosphopantothenate synthase [Roseicitreum antarcticum]|nr:bifunctional phosphopantothenoylcysteine decarboxylase/phosphopantothenate synthase [Roseicitreum antarcticum]
MLAGRQVLLIIGGGIAAYKALELIRLLRGAGAGVVPVMTTAAAQFVTPLSVAALAGHRVYATLFDLKDEAEMGHIQLSRLADLIVVAPATSDLLAKMAGGHADDLASTLLLATDTPVLVAPAMNVRMWDHPATRRNMAQVQGDGVACIGPDSGEMACGEYGPGRMAEPTAILQAVREILRAGGAPDGRGAVGGGQGIGLGIAQRDVSGTPTSVAPVAETGAASAHSLETAAAPLRGPLTGRHVLITSGPTHEPIDPVRYIANRSSGAQGAALAAACRDLGARVTFVTGPASVPPPAGVDVVRVETALEMLAAVQGALPADVAIFAAAVADWRVANAGAQKLKKTEGGLPVLEFSENPDILATVSAHPHRPALVVGFAAETHDVAAYAHAKRLRKGCDWIVANDVSPGTGIMGGSDNAVHLITADGSEVWPMLPKTEVARRLANRIAAVLPPGTGDSGGFGGVSGDGRGSPPQGASG